MTKRNRRRPEILEAAESAEAAAAAEAADEAAAAEAEGAQASAEQQLAQELDELKDRHLRLAAEYDNYRKRVLRERAELRGRLQADLAKLMLDAIDDLTRVTEVDPDSASARDVIAGVELVERKVMKELEGIGLARIGREGEVFDPNEHEAVGAEPTPDSERDGTVATVLQPGYKLGEMLVRPARVRVFVAANGDGAE